MNRADNSSLPFWYVQKYRCRVRQRATPQRVYMAGAGVSASRSSKLPGGLINPKHAPCMKFP